jgi:hypothetical protein
VTGLLPSGNDFNSRVLEREINGNAACEICAGGKRQVLQQPLCASPQQPAWLLQRQLPALRDGQHSLQRKWKCTG